ncbi:MAG: hypothetical protein ABMA25_04105 [Ilumatobacteraceae bacterium]
MELGTIPDWIGAIGTTGAFIVAVGLLGRELRDRRVAQARLVSAWVTEVDNNQQEPITSVVVQNRSGEPVYEVTLSWFDPVAHADVGEGGEILIHLTVLPPDTRQQAADSVPTRMGHLPALTLSFTDSSDRRWTRRGSSLNRSRTNHPEI